MTDVHSATKRLSSGAYIATFLILLLILVIFGDLFVFILGTIGLTITFAYFYKGNSHADAHHEHSH
ncbi:hypothetical protein DYBT9275_03215 [Dyadobacter sp. CECT 9275]|uniref:Uncharacterized protein n=1 Tax=Dyadobacter helix TaxID=2822344 RepID=A0A916JH77_9BACT|nr:hypothetical protein [Dyadobacter sp. CECT 9275]CAG5003716.1 hypothetical protein DYBT9275_03215 [Dyadobacter sp. CECT 9275]